MALRKGSAYTKRYARPYVRKSKVRTKSYIKAVPYSKIVKFCMGDQKGFMAGKYPIVLTVKSREKVQMRDNAIEAARQYFNRFIIAKVGKEFYFEVKPYPHHVLRENKMLTGAGADRMQTGMSQSFGKSIGRAAFIKKDQPIFIFAVLNTKHEAIVRTLIKSLKARLPCRIYIEDQNGNGAVEKKKIKKPKKKKIATENTEVVVEVKKMAKTKKAAKKE